jgi:hypothetical protein
MFNDTVQTMVPKIYERNTMSVKSSLKLLIVLRKLICMLQIKHPTYQTRNLC